MNSANIGCHRDSTNSVPIDVVHAGNLDEKVLEPDAGLADHECVQRHEIHSGGSSQHLQHGEYALPLLASGVDGASMVSQVGMNHQSPHRNVSNVPSPDAKLGLSVERGDEHKGLTWSSVVTKNTLGVAEDALPPPHPNAIDGYSGCCLCYGSACHNWIKPRRECSTEVDIVPPGCGLMVRAMHPMGAAGRGLASSRGDKVYEEDVTCEMLVLVLEHYALTCYVILSCQYGLCGSVDACSLIILVLIPPGVMSLAGISWLMQLSLVFPDTVTVWCIALCDADCDALMIYMWVGALLYGASQFRLQSMDNRQ
ncbi:hypothetical protein Nepgr_033536 [Nepenthes gracilis]|uniref:Uncharacterized protein n=1 Tax=Nepenthes gracilis TaxID=150966 RepID=A0AAD3Y6P0_NEPGR|nr:hypothetical protein Nepgr_033536 [Nepenthes gracilis]